MGLFEDFKQKEKFVEDSSTFYPGIASPELLPFLMEKINLSADDFKNISLQPNPADEAFQNKIKTGLQRFGEIYLDTEDRERVCHYFEELMDIVGLESSRGHLMNFMYGFNPDDIKK